MARKPTDRVSTSTIESRVSRKQLESGHSASHSLCKDRKENACAPLRQQKIPEWRKSRSIATLKSGRRSKCPLLARIETLNKETPSQWRANYPIICQYAEQLISSTHPLIHSTDTVEQILCTYILIEERDETNENSRYFIKRTHDPRSTGNF